MPTSSSATPSSTHIRRQPEPAQHPPVYPLAITLDRQPSALLLTRNRLRTAMRRGAPWPTKRPSSCLVARGAVSRRQIASRPSLHGSRALLAPSTGTWLGVPARDRSAWWPRRGPDAGRAVVTLSASSASVRCPVRASVSTRACPRDRCPVSCAGGRPSVLGVQCPTPRVRAFPRRLGPTEVRL